MKRVIILIFSLCLFATLEGQTSIIRAWNFARAQVVSAPTEMITNGTFTSTNNWTTGAVWVITTGSPGYATFDDTNSGSLTQSDANMAVSILPNTNYVLEFDIDIASSSAYLGIFNANLGVNYVAYNNYNDGHQTVNFTSPADVGVAGFTVYGNDGSGNPFTITNISLKLQ
jgi:hypothetical protein